MKLILINGFAALCMLGTVHVAFAEGGSKWSENPYLADLLNRRLGISGRVQQCSGKCPASSVRASTGEKCLYLTPAILQCYDANGAFLGEAGIFD